MASYAELLQTCTEFQENFSVLTGRYNALALELRNVKAVSERAQQQLTEAAGREEQLHRQLTELKREMEKSTDYEERYRAATVTVEQLKSQVTNARQREQDAVLEHSQEMEQLKTQIEDMAKRVETAADGRRLRESQKQVLELEERCAAINAQLLEERERHSQQLLTAHNALREQQSRNLELEQRYRSIETDASEMRATVRRSTELQNEAALLKERYATAASVAQRRVEELGAECDEARRRIAQLKEDHQNQQDKAEQQALEERHELEERIAILSADVASSQSRVAEEKAKYAKLQTSLEEQVQLAQNAALMEMSALRRAQAALKEENTRLQWRVEKLNDEVSEGQQLRQVAQERHESLAAKLQQAQQHLDAAAQQEAWLTSEKRRFADELSVARQRNEELSKAVLDNEAVSLQLQQLTIRLEHAEEEAQHHRHAALQCESQLRDFEEASALKTQALRRELKAYKKQCAHESARVDSLRRKLVKVLAEREAELYRDSRCPDGLRTLSAAREEPATLVGTGYTRSSSYGDVISMLKNQSQQAEDLHTRLVQLAR